MRNQVLSLTLIVQLIYPLNIFAHSEGHAPVDQMEGIRGAVDKNRAGYGWLNSTSEAAAEGFFHQLCPADGGNNVQSCVPKDSEFASYMKFSFDNIEVAMQDMLREQQFEYFALQSAAIGEVPKVPKCLKDNSKMTVLKHRLKDMIGYTDKQLKDNIKTKSELLATYEKLNPGKTLPTTKEKRLLATKLRAMRGAMDRDRIAQALILDKQLHKHERDYCDFSKTDDSSKMKCMNIRRKRDRIRQSFPMIFEMRVGGFNNTFLTLFDKLRRFGKPKDPCGKDSRTEFEASVYEIVGAYGAPVSMSGQTAACEINTRYYSKATHCPATERRRLECRGQKIVDGHIDKASGYNKLYSNRDGNKDGDPDGLINRIFKKIKEDDLDDEKEEQRVKKAKKAYEKSFMKMKKEYAKSVAEDIRALCSESPTRSIKQLASTQPHVVRQMVLDQEDPKVRNAMRAYLCQIGAMNTYQKYSQSHSCKGVKVETDGTVKVKRKIHGFPFASDSNYEIKKDDKGVYTVTTKMNYIFKCDETLVPGPKRISDAMILKLSDKNKNGSIDPDEFDYNDLVGDCDHQEAKFAALTSKWVTQATDALNKGANGVKDPKVKFKIKKCTPTTCGPKDEPLVNVAACYNRKKPKADQYVCGKVGGRNWADAGGYPLSTPPGTIAHETGHSLGLADEYVASYYPAHAVGEYGYHGGCNSTMGSTKSGKCHDFYPRHLYEIIRPARMGCEDGEGPADKIW
jgi:hypothetical protein